LPNTASLGQQARLKVREMTEQPPDMKLKAIGIVRNGVKQPIRHGWSEVVSDIVIDSHLAEALDGLDQFSHLIVLYWMHQLNPRRKLPLKVHPMGKAELPLMGRFATRSPSRPNPVGQATVRLLERRDNILKVKGLDAIDGTPVIDIKPYIPGYDSATDAKAPRWTTNH
jgi:tRNA-Thr(GGU) m(6)t(6)A37 methyltransferase TsaA